MNENFGEKDLAQARTDLVQVLDNLRRKADESIADRCTFAAFGLIAFDHIFQGSLTKKKRREYSKQRADLFITAMDSYRRDASLQFLGLGKKPEVIVPKLNWWQRLWNRSE